jgi:hypothetical protein
MRCEPMPLMGQKQTSHGLRLMSALDPIVLQNSR